MTIEDLAGSELPRRPVPSPLDASAASTESEPTADVTVEDVTLDEVKAPVTGDEDVDALIAQLVAHAAVPLEDQLPILEAVHRTLQDRLADVEG